MKICFVTEDFYPEFIGGQGVYGYRLVSGLVKKGSKVIVLAEKRGDREEYWKKNSRLILVPFCFGNQIVLSLLEFIYFKLKLSHENFDILHTNQLSGLFFVLFRPKNVKKIIVSAHNTNFDMFWVEESIIKRTLYLPLIFLERIIYKKADGIVVNSPLEAKEFKNRLVKVVYLGAPKVKFSEEERRETRHKVRKQLGLEKKEKIVLYVGRIVKRKKVSTLVAALQKLHPTGVIIGTGAEKKKLQGLATSNIKFLGYVKDTRPYFLAADVFVTISVAEGGVALTTLEAGSFGLPLIISSSAAGVPIVKEGKNGYIVDPDNPAELAKKIQLALKKKTVFGKESLRLARFFSWERCVTETLSFYQSLLGKL